MTHSEVDGGRVGQHSFVTTLVRGVKTSSPTMSERGMYERSCHTYNTNYPELLTCLTTETYYWLSPTQLRG